MFFFRRALVQESQHGGYRHGRRNKPTHRRLLPTGAVPKPQERTPEHNALLAKAMWTGRTMQASSRRDLTRKRKLSALENNNQRTAIRVGQLARSARKAGQKATDFTTLGKLEVAFPVGPLRSNAAAAERWGCGPGTISYTRKGLSELLIRDHTARTIAAAENLQRTACSRFACACGFRFGAGIGISTTTTLESYFHDLCVCSTTFRCRSDSI